jgi:hypothetical protein
MRQKMKTLILAATVVIVAIALAMLDLPLRFKGKSGGPGPPISIKEPAGLSAEKMDFGSGELSLRIGRVLEGVSGTGNCIVALREAGQARWICILTAGSGRYCSLDTGFRIEDFSGLSPHGFQAPPPPILKILSIFTSLAKREMKYKSESGDRVIVLSCPKEEWSQLNLIWPEFSKKK